MPEGDSVFKYARSLRPVLVGKTIVRFELRERGEVEFLAGRLVQSIDVLGKHMMIAIEPDWVLRVHLGMKGRWFVNGAHERRRPPPSETRVLIATSDHAVYCVRASTAELTRARDPKLRARLHALGPDVLAEDFDPAQAAARAREHADTPIAEVILDQRVAAGIGNVYRSELLFKTQVHPRKLVRELDDDTLVRIYALARELMRANLGPGPRTTAGTHQGARHAPNVSHHYAYRRHGLPCHRCGTPIERELIGDLARSIYFCPRCQKR
jgi:endonuclease-8